MALVLIVNLEKLVATWFLVLIKGRLMMYSLGSSWSG